MTTTPPTEQRLDEITARAAHLHEYATLTDGPLQADADQLTGEDVPAMRAEIHRLRTENATVRAARDVIASLYRDLDARLDAVAAFLDEQERAARLFELPTPAWVEAVRAASAAPAAPPTASYSPAGDRDGETGTEGAAGRVGDSGAVVAEEAATGPEFTEARAAFMQIGHTPSLEGLRTELRIEGWPPIVGSYNGASMQRMHDVPGHEHLLAVEPRLIFEYAEEQPAAEETAR